MSGNEVGQQMMKVSGGAASSTAVPAVDGEEGPLDPAVLAVLPQDAPPDHEVHNTLRWDSNHKWPNTSFTYHGHRLQTTLGMAHSKEAALRIARACFIKFEEGESFDQVKSFRQSCYVRIREVLKAQSGKAPGARKRKADAIAEAAAAPPPANGTAGAKAAAAPVAAPAPSPPVAAASPPLVLLGRDGKPLEDAPPGHEAWDALRFDRSYHWTYLFKLPKGCAEMLASVRKEPKYALKPARCNHNHVEAKRILRLCYLKFQEDANKEEVREYMDRLIEQSKAAGYNGAPSTEEEIIYETSLVSIKQRRKQAAEAEAEEEAPPAKMAKVPKEAKEPKEPKEGKAPRAGRAPKEGKDKEPKEVEAPSKNETPQRAPESTLRAAANTVIDGIVLTEAAKAQRIKIKTIHGKPDHLWFEYVSPSGQKTRFQTTVNMSGGCSETAERIARLCYAKFETGATKAEVEEFRSKHYKLCGGPINQVAIERVASEALNRTDRKTRGSKKSTNESAGGTLASILPRLQQEGRLDGALRLFGRELSKKNSSINGIYCKIPEGFGGKGAYQKADDSVKRFLFYSARKGRWKIHESLDDTAAGFAYAKGSGDSHPGSLLTWAVFDGSGKGYVDDTDVKCELIADSADAKAAADGGGEAPVAAAAEADNSDSASDSEEDQVSDSPSGGSSAGSSGSSSSESGDEAAVSTVSTPAVKAETATAAATGARKNGARRGRACAKMLVKSGLRCPCHFAYPAQCPTKNPVATTA